MLRGRKAEDAKKIGKECGLFTHENIFSAVCFLDLASELTLKWKRYTSRIKFLHTLFDFLLCSHANLYETRHDGVSEQIYYSVFHKLDIKFSQILT